MIAEQQDFDSQKHIWQLEEELRLSRQRQASQQQRQAEQRQRLETQRREIAQKFGSEFLALIEGDPRANPN